MAFKKNVNPANMKTQEVGFVKTSLINSARHAEEIKSLTREKFLREFIEKAQKYVNDHGMEKLKDHVGSRSVKKIPTALLKEIDASDLQEYLNMLTQSTKLQLEISKTLNVFPPAEKPAKPMRVPKDVKEIIVETKRADQIAFENAMAQLE